MSAAVGRDDRRVAGLLGVAFFLLYALFVHGYFAGSDEVGVFEVTASLYENGDLTVPPGVHVLAGRGGRMYNHFGVGQALLALPLYAAGSLAARVLPAAWVEALAGQRILLPHGLFGGTVPIFMVCLFAPLASGALVGLFYLFERRLGASVGSALAAAAVLGGATYVATMSVYFLQHTTEALLVLGALYGFLVWKESGRIGALLAGSVAASYLILVRVAAAAAAPGLAGYLLHAFGIRRRREGGGLRLGAVLLAVAIPFALAVGVYAAVNYARWERWLWSPALAESQHFTKPIYVALYGFLLSPGCGIFAYSPPLLLLPWTLPALWRRHRAECVTIVAIVASFLLLCSRYRFWTGLWSSPGPRYLFVATPLLMLPLGPWLDAHRSRAARLVVAAVALVGAGAQLALVATRWTAVVQMMGYERFAPDMAFVFLPDFSPILASARLLAERGLGDVWLGLLAWGWEGHAGSPGVALALGLVWLVAFGAAVALLVRAARAASASVALDAAVAEP